MARKVNLIQATLATALATCLAIMNFGRCKVFCTVKCFVQLVALQCRQNIARQVVRNISQCNSTFIPAQWFTNATTKDRFPTFAEEELVSLRGKNQAKTLKKLCWMFSTSWKWSVTKRENWKISLIPWSRAKCNFRWSSKKGRTRMQTREFDCHAMLVGLAFEKLGRNYSILWDREFANSRL